MTTFDGDFDFDFLDDPVPPDFVLLLFPDDLLFFPEDVPLCLADRGVVDGIAGWFALCPFTPLALEFRARLFIAFPFDTFTFWAAAEVVDGKSGPFTPFTPFEFTLFLAVGIGELCWPPMRCKLPWSGCG